MEVRHCKKRWELKTGPDGRKFYVDHKRRKSLWQLPPNCDQQEVVIVNNNFHFRWVKKTAPPSSGKNAGKPFYVDYWNLSTHWQPPSPERRWDVIALFAFGCAGDVGSFQWGPPGAGLATDKEFSYKCVKSLGEMKVAFTERGLSFTPTQLTVVAGKKKKGSRVGDKAAVMAFGMDRIHSAHDCGILGTEDARRCRDVVGKLKAQGLSSSSAKAAAAAIEAKAKAVFHVQVDMRDGTKYIILLSNQKHCERLVKCIRAGLQWFQGKSIDYMQVNRESNSRSSATNRSQSGRSSSQASYLSPGSMNSGSGDSRRNYSTGNIPHVSCGHSSAKMAAAGAAGSAAGAGAVAASQQLHRAKSDVQVHQQGQHPRQQRNSGQAQYSQRQQQGQKGQQGLHDQQGQHSNPSLYHSGQGSEHGQHGQNKQSQHSQGPHGQNGQPEEPSSPRMQIPILCQAPQAAHLQQEPSFIQAPMQMPAYYMPPQQAQQQPTHAYPPGPGGYPVAAYPVYGQQPQGPPGYGDGAASMMYPQQQVPQEPPPPYCPPSSERGHQPPGSSDDCLMPPAHGSGGHLESGYGPVPSLSPCPSPPHSPLPSPRAPDPMAPHDSVESKAVTASLAVAAAAAAGAVGLAHSKGSAEGSSPDTDTVITPVVAVEAGEGATEVAVGEVPPPEENEEEDQCGRAWLEKVAAIPFPPALLSVQPVTGSGWRKFLAGGHHQRLDKDAKVSMEEFVNATGQWKLLVAASQELQESLRDELSGAYLVPSYVVAWSLLDVYLTAKATQAKAAIAAKQYLEVLGEEFLRFSIREALSIDMESEEGDSFTVKQSGIILEVASFASVPGCQASKELQKKFLVLQASGSMTRGLVPGSVSIPLACLLDLPTSRVLVTARPFARTATVLSNRQEKASADVREGLSIAANLPQESTSLLKVTVDNVGLFRISDTPELFPRHTLAIFGPPSSAARVRPELLQLLLNEELLTSAGHGPLLCPTLPQLTTFIVDVMIPAFLKVVSSWLEVLTTEFGFQILVYFLHAYGLNIRLLAVLRAGIPPDGRKIRRLFMTEMAARSLRNVIRKQVASSRGDEQQAVTVQTLIKAICAGEEREWHLLLDELEIAFPGIGLPGNNDVNGKGEITVTLDAITPELLVRRTLQMVGGYASDEMARWLASPMPLHASSPPGSVTLAPLSRATVPRALLWTVIQDNETDCKAQLLLTALLEHPLDDGAHVEFLDRASGTFGANALRSFASTSGAIKSDSLAPIGVRLVGLLTDFTGKRVEACISPAFNDSGEPTEGAKLAAASAFFTRFHNPCGVYALNEGLARLLLSVGLDVAETADESESEGEDSSHEEKSLAAASIAVYERALGFLFAALHELQSHMHVSEMLLDIYTNIIGIMSCLPQSYPHRDHLLFSMAVYHLEAHEAVLSHFSGVRPRSEGLHVFMTTLSQLHPTTFGVGAMAMWKLRAYQCLSALAKEKLDMADCTAFDQVVDLCRSEGVDVSQIPLQMDVTQKEFFASLSAERKGLRKHTLPAMMQMRIASITHLLGYYCKPWRRA